MTWNVDSTTLMILAGICVTVGFIAGLAVGWVRSASSGENKTSPDLEEVFRVLRSKTGTQLWVEAEGKTAADLNEFDNQEKQKILAGAKGLALMVRRTLNPQEQDLSADAPQPKPPAAPPENLKSEEEAEVLPQAALSQESSGELFLEGSRTVNGERPRVDPIKGLRLALEGDANTDFGQKSIAAQVDDILQENIKGSELEKRGVRLMELPGRGMVVLIGLEQYDSVDEVPYPEIKSVLKEAVATWEKKMLG